MLSYDVNTGDFSNNTHKNEIDKTLRSMLYIDPTSSINRTLAGSPSLCLSHIAAGSVNKPDQRRRTDNIKHSPMDMPHSGRASRSRAASQATTQVPTQ